MGVRLDLKDLKLLHALDKNSRQSNQSIAKATKISKQVVGFRIKRLIEDNIITCAYTIIDISKLSRVAHKNFIRLQNVTPEKEKEIINYFTNHPKVVWCASADGRFDFIFSIWATNLLELDTTLKEINSKYGNFIAERQISTIIKGEYFSRDYLLGKKSRENKSAPSFIGIPEEEKLDPINIGILRLISINSRLSSVSLGKSIGISADAISNRIKKLEQAKVITGYTIVPNETNYPYLHYKLLISTRASNSTMEESFREYCKVTPNIVYFVKALGQWDYEIDIETISKEEFRTILMNFKTQFKDFIKDYSTLFIYKVHKYNFCPSNPYEY